MNPNYGYQLYQSERTQTRAEVLAGDAQRGRWAADFRRGRQGPARQGRGPARGGQGPARQGRGPARRGRGRGIMVIIAGRTARAA
jgi:hypothetical protein